MAAGVPSICALGHRMSDEFSVRFAEFHRRELHRDEAA
jgi:hypothetical protein